jgi:hypothetical protein
MEKQMSHKHDEDHGRTRHRRSHCGVKRVIRGLAERFSVSRGTVIAGFVVGFVFVPILTGLVFAAAWFWVDDPERFESRLNGAADWARKAYDWTFGSKVPKESTSAEEIMAEPVPDFPNLRRAFERLETRTGNIEAYVSSDEYRLHREFRDMRDAR